MYNPQELQRKAQLNLHGVDNYAQTNIETNPPKEDNEQHWLVRGLATVGNFFTNIAEGAIKSIEGIVDAGAMLVGLFGADVEDFVSWDITSDVFGTDEEGEGLLDWAWGRNLSEVSYLDDSSIVNQIAEGVGGMLPTIGLAALSGGTSLAGTAAAKGLKVASKVGFIAGASGNAAESALQEGASFGQAFSYGAISGAIEGVTEKIGGRLFGETSAQAVDKTLLGKGLAKLFGEKAITKGAGKFVYNFVSEGLEEVVADLLDPFNKRITGVDTEAKVNWSELPKTFLVGGAVGSVLEGVQNAGSAIAHKKEGGKHYTKIANDLQNIADYQKGLAVLQGSKKVTQEQLDSAIVKNSERTLDYLEDISTELKAMTEEQRANALKTLGENSSYISELYEKDGTLKSDAYDTYSEVIQEGGKGYNVSTNLLYKKKEVEGKLAEINKADHTTFELSDATFNEEERKNFAKINRNIAKLSNKTGTDLELVVIKENKKANAFIKGNTIYVSNEHLADGTWARYLSHEITHFARESKEFKSFAEYVTKDTKALENAILVVDKNYKYGYSVETAKQIINNVQSGSKNVTNTELEFYDEVVAHITEELFQSEKSIESFARENTTLAQKILNKIREFLSIFKGTNADSKTVVNLRRAEMLFERALRSMGKEVEEATKEATRIKSKGERATAQYLKDKETYNNLTEDEKAKWLKDKGYKAEDFADDVLGEDKVEDVDNSGEIRYAKKGYAKKQFAFQYGNFPPNNETHNTAHQDALHWAKRSSVEVEEQRLIYSNGYWYVVEKFSDFLNNYQVVERISNTTFDKIYKEIKENGRSGRIKSISSSTDFIDKLNQPSYSLKTRKSSVDSVEIGHGKEDNQVQRLDKNQVERGERTGSNGARDSSQSRSNKQGIKFSLKDSIEKDVTNKYGNTYNWRETGYILTDGTRLDLSGKREGAMPGGRTIDHRDIFGDYEDIDGTDAMVEFMSRGNIRVSPEYPGINLQVEPTAEQYRLIQDLVERLGWKEKYFSVDFDNKYGDVVETLSYEGNVSGRKVVSDIKYYFKEGKLPYQSDLSKFRYSLKPSEGQIIKKVADYTKKKVYNKAEAESILNSIIGNVEVDDNAFNLVGKNKEYAINYLWKALNTAESGKRTGIALKIADYVIDNSILESVYKEEELKLPLSTIGLLKDYFHQFDLDNIREDINHRYDKNSGVYMLWGKRKGEQGKTADVIAQELVENGFEIKSNNEADMFFEIVDAYKNAVSEVNELKKKVYGNSLSKEQKSQLRQDIAKDILRAYDNNGKKTKLADIIEKQGEKAQIWKNLYYEERKRNNAINSLLYEVDKLKANKEFQNSSQFRNELFKGNIEKLAKINWRGNLNESGTRNLVAGINAWYNKDNQLINSEQFNEEVKTILNDIAQGTGKLSADEIKQLANVMAYFRHFIETNNKIKVQGEYIDAREYAEKFIDVAHANKDLQVGVFGRLINWAFNNKKHSYMEAFSDPATVVRYMDRYDENGFFTRFFEDFREGALNAELLEMDLLKSLESFRNEHKKYFKELAKKTFKYNGIDIPASNVIQAFMSENREQALIGLAISGFSYVDDSGNEIRIDGFVNEGASIEEIREEGGKIQAELYSQFNELEKEYISIMENIYKRCGELKAKTDIERQGYTNVTEDYYIPIKRAYIAKNIDSDTFFDEVNRVSNLSFNKSVKKGAKNELFIEDAEVVLRRHVKGIAKYVSLANVVDNFNIIYNIDVNANPNKPINVKSETKNSWQNGEKFMSELLADIQGMNNKKTDGVFSFLRQSYAKFQLGANPKVWLTQLSSFFASTSILDFTSVIKSFGVNGSDVDKYCKLAELRNSENTVAIAQGGLREIGGKISEVSMKPIGAMDRLVVRKLFSACQVQVAKDNGLKIGTEENKVKAGELLKKVILETQQNSLATERSSAMRSTSEIKKTLTMFTADAMKVIGRVADAYLHVAVIKAKIRKATNPSEINALKAELKKANKQCVKSTMALTTQALFMALVAQLFKHLYNKEDEDETIIESMTVDFFGNLLGGLPIYKDVYGKIFEGYDFKGYQYSAINDILDAFNGTIGLVGDVINGRLDSRKLASNLRKLVYAVGQVTGLPLRNAYNVIYGLINRFSPELGYRWNDKFYKQSYNADLKKAIENEDEGMINTIAGLIMDENVGAFSDASTRTEINRLIGKGYDVLPQSTPNSVTINEEEYSLDNRAKREFKKVYEQSISDIGKLVSSNGYKIASDEAKAKAVKYIYRYYYYEAQAKSLNAELDTKLYLFGNLIPIEKMALALAEAPIIAEKSKDKKQAVQKYLQGLKLNATQKTMLMGYFGYSIKNSESAVKNLVNKSNLTKNQKKILLEKCGL